MAQFQWSGADALIRNLLAIANPDPTPLLEVWEDIIRDGNERGVMEGRDKDDNPIKPVTYRPTVAVRTSSKTKPTTGGITGPFAAGFDDNLTYAQYRKLSGPPTAPRGRNSRVIKNFFTQHGRDPARDYEWFAEGRWFDVVDAKGRAFLPDMFSLRDLRGVRPRDVAEAERAVDDWIKSLLGG